MDTIPEEKIFECHKIALSCQSEVFEAMFKDGTKMVESESGEVKIDDAKADTLENMIYFMYFNKILDEKRINPDLLILADRYMVKSLTAFCVEHFKQNLSFGNALEVLVSAYVTPNQKALFNSAAKFVCENRKKLVKTENWKELSNDATLMQKVFLAMLNVE